MNRFCTLVLVIGGLFILNGPPAGRPGGVRAVVSANENSFCEPSFLSQPQSPAAGRFEERIDERINLIRRERGLAPLRNNAVLGQVARSHSCRMAAEDLFSHRGLSGRSPADRVRQAGLSFSFVGENLGMVSNMSDPANGTVEGWMQSEAHRANILNPNFTQTGVGIWNEERTFYITQLFMRP